MAWESTGEWVSTPGDVDRIPPFDPRSGDHLWIIMSTYRWGGPDVERSTLDTENLLSIMGPVCYYCEQPWTARLATRRCPGESA